MSKLILEKKNSYKNKRNDKRKKEINMKKNLNLNKKEYFENKKDILDYNPNEDNDQKTNNIVIHL